MSKAARKLARERKRRGLPVENAPRTCGSCTACCTVLGVPELKKSRYQPCVHADGKCNIYSERPASCRAFQCLWLQGIGTPNQRPDKVGVVLSVSKQDPELSQQMVLAYECKPNGIKVAEPIILGLGKVSVVMLIRDDPGEQRRVIGPQHLVDEVERLVKKRLPLVDPDR